MHTDRTKQSKIRIPLRIAKLSGFYDLSFDSSLLVTDRTIQDFASKMQAVRSPEGKSKEAASAHKFSGSVFVI
jgi:hypothetical protein